MSSARLFGTDGVRGIPGYYPLTRDFIRKIARVTAETLCRRDPVNGGPPTVVMGRDTRGSGPSLCRSLTEGFHSAGCRTIDLGVVPTPAVSYLVPRLKAACGAMVSASHNPAEFNGIKMFTGDGFKMSAALESEIESRLKGRSAQTRPSGGRTPGARGAPGRVSGPEHLVRYVEFLRSTFPATIDLTGMRIVVDCGNGAVSRIAPGLFRGLGAEVTALGCSPDGRNINKGCGALETASMRRAVVKHRAHAGVSFDGDADRAIFSDEKGSIVDGDAIICLSALRMRERGELSGGGVVLTIMSNYGLVRFLEGQGITVVTVPVGDRNVTEEMERRRFSLGGENSGHVVYRNLSATGDGLLTALQTLAVLKESQKPLSVLRGLYRSVPQILRNVPVARKVPLAELPRVSACIRRCEAALKGLGRVFVRYSGTEPALRIMIEGPRRSELERMAKDLTRIYLRETAQERSPA